METMGLFIETKSYCRGTTVKIFLVKMQRTRRHIQAESIPRLTICAHPVASDRDKSHSNLQFEDGQGSSVP